MEKQKGYIVLEVGYEYNDEYYHTGNNGDMYEAPDKVFTDKEKAIVELEKKTIEKLRGENLGYYNGNGVEGICKKDMIRKFETIMEQEFELNVDDYEFEIPKTATDEQLRKVMECLKLKFFELVEVELN